MARTSAHRDDCDTAREALDVFGAAVDFACRDTTEVADSVGYPAAEYSTLSDRIWELVLEIREVLALIRDT
jgi:hypothetical protein